jgi:peptidoglycan/xylan/chitin deacetylase (PgdA/CDA1 family)
VAQDDELVASRFLFGGAADDVLREWLEADMRASRLSWAFRTYYLVRSLLPLRLRQFLQCRRRVIAPPDWCFPNAWMRDLTDCVSTTGDGITTIHPWPDGCQFAFVLTHDVETADGMRRVAQIADLEEELGYRSSWNIVPYKYRVDRGLLRDLRRRGFEIGVHGYNHDGRLFSSRRVFNRRAPRINAALETFGAVGFRAPMVHRNLSWLQALDIEYDASCFDADPYQAMPGGVGSVWPFIAGRFVELPYTLPQDHTLFIVLRERDGRIWHQKLRYVAQLHGMSLVITHPDYLDSDLRLDAYRRLLNEAREMAGVWHALPREVAAWWRARDESRLRQEADGTWRIDGPAADRARAATLRAAAACAPARCGNDRDDFSSLSPPLVLEWTEPSPHRRPSAPRREHPSENSIVSVR